MSEHLQKETRDDAVLSLRNVTMRFGGVTALNAVNIDLYPGEILALIGPNGAGKTTVFNVVTGVYQATEGDIVFNGERLNGMKRFDITKKGIARTFQNIRLWGDMTALENVITGTDVHKKSGFIGALFGSPRSRREEKASRARAQELLEYEDLCLTAGYEGVMLRNPTGKYKCGRSTLKEQILLKLKRFLDAEAIVVGFEEKMHNDNVQEKNELGLSKRSFKKDGLVFANTLGSLIVEDPITKTRFGIGTGFDDCLKLEIWNNKEKYLNESSPYSVCVHANIQGSDLVAGCC